MGDNLLKENNNSEIVIVHKNMLNQLICVRVPAAMFDWMACTIDKIKNIILK
jgi:hypothetical protein